MLQSWYPSIAFYWNTPAWSVSVEAFFYLLFPFLAPWCARRASRHLLAIMGAVWLLALLSPFLLCFLSPVACDPMQNEHSSTWIKAIQTNPLARTPEFVLGMLLGNAYASTCVRWRARSLIALVGAAVWLSAIICWRERLPHALVSNGLAAPGFALLIWGLALGSGKLNQWLCRPELVTLGEASYALYILHFPIALWFLRWTPLTRPGAFAAYLGTVLTVSVVSYRYVETPLRRAIRHWVGVRAKLNS